MNIIMSRLRQFWSSRYVSLLEEEVDRLRGENRALVNSLLGTAGFPPVNFPEAPPVTAPGPRRVRRRSWQQLQAQREFESTRDLARQTRENPEST